MDNLLFKLNIFEVLNTFASLMIAYGVFIFLYFSRRKERREKVKFSSRYIQKWNEPVFFHILARIFRPENIDFIKTLEPEKYEDFRIGYKDEFDDLVTTLNFIEEIAQAIESDLADEQTLRKYFQQSLVETYLNLENFIQITRRYNPSAYRSTERLIGQWSFSKQVEER